MLVAKIDRSESFRSYDIWNCQHEGAQIIFKTISSCVFFLGQSRFATSICSATIWIRQLTIKPPEVVFPDIHVADGRIQDGMVSSLLKDSLQNQR